MAKSSDTETAPKIIRLRRIEDMILVARITGTTPVIPHKWSEKSIRQMADKQQAEAGAPRPKRLPKNPEEEALDSCYWLDDQGAIPAVSFKAAMVGACRFFDGLTRCSMPRVRAALVTGDLRHRSRQPVPTVSFGLTCEQGTSC